LDRGCELVAFYRLFTDEFNHESGDAVVSCFFDQFEGEYEYENEDNFPKKPTTATATMRRVVAVWRRAPNEKSPEKHLRALI
jgi:hypothetical protein